MSDADEDRPLNAMMWIFVAMLACVVAAGAAGVVHLWRTVLA